MRSAREMIKTVFRAQVSGTFGSFEQCTYLN